jgi:hypothetical protein
MKDANVCGFLCSEYCSIFNQATRSQMYLHVMVYEDRAECAIRQGLLASNRLMFTEWV